MKNSRKFLAIFMIIAMIMTMGAFNAFAANAEVDSGKGGEGSITIDNANPDQTYTFYRIFEAIPSGTNVSYKVLSGKTMETNDYFEVDVAGNVKVKDAAKDADGDLTAAAIEWLTENASQLGEEVATVVPTESGSQTVTGLPLGYYFITTTTGTIVTIDTTMPNATVQDKNPGTSIDKIITSVGTGSIDAAGDNALAQVGTVVEYESRIPIANGARNYKFTDVMTDGLTLNANSIKVYVVEENAEVAEDAEAVVAGDEGYGTLTAANKTGEEADITIQFNDAWLKANVGKDIVIQYSATVNTSAVVSGTEGNPNTAKIEWGNTSETLTDTDDAKVFTAKITVTKVDGNNEPLAGAGFVLKNSEGKYYKYDETTGVSWVEETENPTELTTIADEGGNVVTFTGLANGVYTLVEKTVPEGYNKAADKEITILNADVSVENTAKTETVTNNAGAELPSTGGMGTVLFVACGSVLAVAAVIFLVTKKRLRNMGVN